VSFAGPLRRPQAPLETREDRPEVRLPRPLIDLRTTDLGSVRTIIMPFRSFTPIHSMGCSCAKGESWLWLPMEEGVALDRDLWREG